MKNTNFWAILATVMDVGIRLIRAYLKSKDHNNIEYKADNGDLYSTNTNLVLQDILFYQYRPIGQNGDETKDELWAMNMNSSDDKEYDILLTTGEEYTKGRVSQIAVIKGNDCQKIMDVVDMEESESKFVTNYINTNNSSDTSNNVEMEKWSFPIRNFGYNRPVSLGLFAKLIVEDKATLKLVRSSDGKGIPISEINQIKLQFGKDGGDTKCLIINEGQDKEDLSNGIIRYSFTSSGVDIMAPDLYMEGLFSATLSSQTFSGVTQNSRAKSRKLNNTEKKLLKSIKKLL